jgi:hypothetical protein
MYKDEALQPLAAWYRAHVVDLVRFGPAYSGAVANPASTPLSPLIIDSTTTIRGKYARRGWEVASFLAEVQLYVLLLPHIP